MITFFLKIWQGRYDWKRDRGNRGSLRTKRRVINRIQPSLSSLFWDTKNIQVSNENGKYTLHPWWEPQSNETNFQINPFSSSDYYIQKGTSLSAWTLDLFLNIYLVSMPSSLICSQAKFLSPVLYSCRTALLSSLGSALLRLCLHTEAVSLPPLGHKSTNTAIPLCPISWLPLYQHKDPILMLLFFTRKRNELQAPSCHCKCIDTRSCGWS